MTRGVSVLRRACKNSNQVRRLLALAAIYDGASRAEAAKIGGVARQIIRDWVLRFNLGLHLRHHLPGRGESSRPCPTLVQHRGDKPSPRRHLGRGRARPPCGAAGRPGRMTPHPQLRVPDNVSVVTLPAKCPELNTQENAWQFMRDNWLSNHIFTGYGNIVDHCRDAWNKLARQPWTIMSIGLCDWAHGFRSESPGITRQRPFRGFQATSAGIPARRAARNIGMKLDQSRLPGVVSIRCHRSASRIVEASCRSTVAPSGAPDRSHRRRSAGAVPSRNSPARCGVRQTASKPSQFSGMFAHAI